MTTTAARTTSERIPVLFHPDGKTCTLINSGPALPAVPIYDDAVCSCGRLILDNTDRAHPQPALWQERGIVYGSMQCAAAYAETEPDDRSVDGRPPPEVPAPGEPGAEWLIPDREAELEDVVRGFLAADTTSWGELQVLLARARQLVGGAA